MNWLTSLVPALIGGVCTLIGGVFVYREQNESQIKHAASVLYYDLKSIEKYLRTERSSVNIRYFSEWQLIVAECTFLRADDIELLYKVYDLVYDYDYHDKLKQEHGTVVKEDISQYEELKKNMFYSSKEGLNMDRYNSEYTRLLETLKQNQKK